MENELEIIETKLEFRDSERYENILCMLDEQFSDYFMWYEVYDNCDMSEALSCLFKTKQKVATSFINSEISDEMRENVLRTLADYYYTNKIEANALSETEINTLFLLIAFFNLLLEKDEMLNEIFFEHLDKKDDSAKEVAVSKEDVEKQNYEKQIEELNRQLEMLKKEKSILQERNARLEADVKNLRANVQKVEATKDKEIKKTTGRTCRKRRDSKRIKPSS